MGLLEKIKNDVKRSGASKGKIAYFREGQKTRIRFLTDMEDGMEIKFHDSFAKSINVPCQEIFGRECKYCDDDELRTRSQYCWSIWDYEANEVKLFMFPVNNCTPLPALMALYDNYGTLIDRDYVVTVSGKQQNKTYSVVPMDKAKFRNEKAKPFSESAILKILDKAFPAEDSVDEEDEEDEKLIVKHASKKQSKIEEDDSDDASENDYSEMSAKELYQLCVKRGIEAEKRKNERYYIKLLDDADKAEDDWEDESDDDEWEDD